MGEQQRKSYQWALQVIVYHGPGFGHQVDIVTHQKGRDETISVAGRWNSLGIPELVLNQLRAAVDSRITEHFVSRYGVEGELPLKWAGEPDPF